MDPLKTSQEISSILKNAIEEHHKGNLQQALDKYMEVLKYSPNNEDALHYTGLIYHQVGHSPQAIEYIEKAIAINPKQATFFGNLGLAYAAENNFDKAISCYKQAINIKSNYPEALYNLANSLKSIGNHNAAIEEYKKAIEAKPDYVQAYNNLGLTQQENGNSEQAIKNFEKAIQINPNFTEAIDNLNRIKPSSKNKKSSSGNFSNLSSESAYLLKEITESLNQKNHVQAVNLSKKLISFNLDNSEILYFCAMINTDIKNFDEAIDLMQKAIELHPENPKYINGLGMILVDKKSNISTIDDLTNATKLEHKNHSDNDSSYEDSKDFIEAEKAYLKALSLDDKNHLTYHYLGTIQRNLNKFDSAISNLKKAIELNPSYIQTHLTLGMTYFSIGCTPKAIEAFNSSLKIDHESYEARQSLSYAYISEGDFENGWNEYEFRLNPATKAAEKTYGLNKILQWEKNSQPKNTPIIILPEQGVGDEVMYASLIPEFCEKFTNEVTLVCDPRLVSIYKRSFPNITVANLNNAKISKDHKKLYVGSLPKILNKSDKNAVQENGFLLPNIDKQNHFFHKYKQIKNLRIGLSWKSGNALEGPRRSIPLLNLKDIISNTKCTFFNLQYGDHQQETHQIESETGIKIINDLEIDPLKNLDDFTSFMSTLDLIITVDNSTAHFAGALGIPTWVMLPYSCDWRWMRNKPDSIWYKSLKLYRQEQIGKWSNVLNTIQSNLSEFSCNTSPKSINKIQKQASSKANTKQSIKTDKKIAFLNDTTSWYHWGCTATSEAIRKRIIQNGYKSLNIPISFTYNFKCIPQNPEDFDSPDFFNNACKAHNEIFQALNSCDQIVINGEESIHYLSNVSLSLLYMAYASKKFLNKPVHIINHSPYPENIREPQDNYAFQIYKAIYNQLDYIAIREHISHKLMTSYGVNASLSFDCLPITVSEDYKPENLDSEKNIVISGPVAFSKDKIADLGKLMQHFHQQGYKIKILHGAKDLPAQDDQIFIQELQKIEFKRYEILNAKSLTEWFDCINSANVFISGRFHHSLAAIYLETPCVMIESNTLKNVALAETFNLPEPIKFDSENFFEELFERTEKALISSPVDAELRKNLLQRSEVNFVKIPEFG